MPAFLKPVLILVAALGAWLALQLYVLPKLGFST